MKFDVIQHLTVVRFWDNVEAENEEQAVQLTVHADVPPDHEKIIESEIDINDAKGD